MAKQKAHGVGKEHTGCTYIFRFEMSEIIHNYAYTFLFGYIMVLEKKLGDGRSLFTLEKKVFRENVFRCCVDEYKTQKWVRKAL